MKLLRNRVKCLECGTVLESKDRHDYRTCGCPNKTMVDGGLDYERYGGVDMDKVETMFEYVEDDVFLWGVLDRETFEITKKPLGDLDDAHIQNIALHLRTRYLPTRHDNPMFTDEENEAIRDGRIRRSLWDARILADHILPELERRGLEEVTEEVPWEK